MRIYNIPPEAFDYPEFRNAYLAKQDWLDISTSKANNIERDLWLEIFSLAPFGLKLYDVRLYSPELLWADVVAMNVPAGWPERTVTDEEGNVTIKKIWEYTYVLRSKTDPTKCMLKYSRFATYNGVSNAKYVAPWGYYPLTHDELKAFYQEFSGFSTHTEAKAWRDLNDPIE